MAEVEVVRLGRLGFLNTLPVYEGLRLLGEAEEAAARFTLVEAGPSPVALNGMMEAGALDLAPVSSIELARQAGALGYVPGMSISSAGPVGSVILFSRVPVRDLDGRPVILPPNSATSVALVRLLARLHWRIAPRFCVGRGWSGYEVAGDGSHLLPGWADGMLLIGDAAIRARVAYPELWQTDLAEEWNALTGLPMVFSVWAYRRAWAEARPAAFRWAAGRLREAQARGLAAVPAMVEAWAEGSGLPVEVLRDYYDRCLAYGLGQAEERGLATFLGLAREYGLSRREERVVAGGRPRGSST